MILSSWDQKEIFSGYQRIFHSAGSIDGKDCNRVRIGMDGNLTNPRGVGQKFRYMGTKGRRNKESYSMMSGICCTRM